MNNALEKANKKDTELKNRITTHRNRLYIDIAIKLIGILVSATIYPSAMMISVLVTMILIIIPSKESEVKNNEQKV